MGAGADKLRSLIPKALDALAAELDAPGPGRLKAAAELLKLLPPPTPSIGPADPEAILEDLVKARRANYGEDMDDLLDEEPGLPPFEDHADAVRRELEARLVEPDDADRRKTVEPA